MDKPLDILAFAAHPDDAELGCGGSLILAADQGRRVAVADLSAGERSTRGTVEQRAQEAKAAGDILGLHARFSLGLPDTAIGTTPEHRLPLIALIRATRPRLVLAPYWQDRHPDHAATSRLVQEACFLAGVRQVGSGAPHRPARLYYYSIHQPFIPSLVVDVSTVWERRMAAALAYESQFRPAGDTLQTAINQPGFMRLQEARAIWFGAMIGAAYGEPFLSHGPVPAHGLPGLDGPERDSIVTYTAML
jgi:bacillithiol biosynthesis deacetylase BshB1